MDNETYSALERVVNQIGGGHTDEFYKDLSKVRNWLELDSRKTE